MTLAKLLSRYERGAIADHEFAAQSLNLLDPHDPSAVLDREPAEILPSLRDFLDQYREGRMIASQDGAIPTLAQVQAAREWIDTSADHGCTGLAGAIRRQS